MKKKILKLNSIILLCTLFACQSGEGNIEDDDKGLASTHPKLEKQLERGDSIPTPISSASNPELYQRYRITMEGFETRTDYRVTERYSGQLAPLNLDSDPEAKQYSADLHKGAAEGINFAGRYTVVSVGCGTSCQQHFIIDRQTGRISDKIKSSTGARYSATSRTFILNPPDETQNYAACPDCTPKPYVIQNGKLEQVQTDAQQ